MSINIKFKNLIKKYNNNTVIPNLSLEINEGEFFTLLGPSGCGKTTLLRMAAGFNSIEGGKVFFDEKCVNDLPPNKRNIGMVFQNYAIFPHLSVKDNIAFGLKNKKTPKSEIDLMVENIMDVVQIKQYANRLPEKLSGGQQQRVALARAIVIQPDVLLMDEPLSNLDAKLRVELRNAIKEIQKKIGITTIYVTHDQEEAMAVSDRIAVMNLGEIQHVGTPKNIYQRPSNLFVSTFIGRSNIIEGVVSNDSVLKFLNYEITMDNIKDNYKGKVKVSIRPEEFIFSDKGIKGKIQSYMFLGLNTHYFIELENKQVIETIQESSVDEILREGSIIYLEVKKKKINLFNAETENNILIGVKNDCEKGAL
ncbi:MAG: ABC transporter ATP-binding protein [Spirochaetia bacterium]|nr:ABC transporter ATP-binding protein [Spirochaetia bacterium]